MNLHWSIIVFTCPLWMPLIALADSTGVAAKVQIFKCVSDSGSVSLQKTLCRVSERVQPMRLTGDSQANREAANRLAAIQAQTDRNEQAQTRDALAREAYLRAQGNANAAVKLQNKPSVVCPPTFGDVVTMQAPTFTYYDAAGNQQAAQRDMTMKYRSLPTKTYLKNAGRWPKECPQ